MVGHCRETWWLGTALFSSFIVFPGLGLYCFRYLFLSSFFELRPNVLHFAANHDIILCRGVIFQPHMMKNRALAWILRNKQSTELSHTTCSHFRSKSLCASSGSSSLAQKSSSHKECFHEILPRRRVMHPHRLVASESGGDSLMFSDTWARSVTNASHRSIQITRFRVVFKLWLEITLSRREFPRTPCKKCRKRRAPPVPDRLARAFTQVGQVANDGTARSIAAARIAWATRHQREMLT